MSDLIRFATPRLTSRAELHAGWLAGGFLTLYDSPVPTTADTALTTQTALATFALDTPAGVVENGVFTSAAVPTALVLEEGIAAFARAVDSSDAVIADYDVGGVGSGAAIEIDNLNLVSGAFVSIVSWTVTEG